jgi:hypothetical protein
VNGVLLIVGSHPRHRLLARRVSEIGCLAGLVIEQREAHVPEAPPGLSSATAALFRHHFAQREAAERKHFGDGEPDKSWNVPVLHVTERGLNSDETRDFIRGIDPTLMLSYGCHKIVAETRAAARGLRWNIHGGLSPWYRGVATHFWPSYLLEPQMTGMTVHELTDELDGGAIVHQCAAPLMSGDGLHDLACRAVAAISEELPSLVGLALQPERLKPPVPQRVSGRIWRTVDWSPAHLHLIYDVYQDRIVDQYLEGHLTAALPSLVRQF